MTFTWLKPALLSLGVWLSSVTLSPAELPKGDEQSHATSLAGQLIVAAPGIADPRFRHAVILIAEHDAQGALGIVINYPVGEQPLADLLAAIGQDNAGITGSVRIFAGGPVDPEVGFVVHGSDYHRAGTIDIDGRVAMTSDPKVLIDIGHNQGPAKSLVAFGYTGWGAGQLESEIARGDWFVEPEDPTLIFDDNRDKVWDDAITRDTIPP